MSKFDVKTEKAEIINVATPARGAHVTPSGPAHMGADPGGA